MSKKRLDMFVKNSLRVSVVLTAVLVIGLVATGSAAGLQTVSGCSVLDTPGETYELDENIQNDTVSTCLEITANNTVLDGGGYAVDGVNQTPNSRGISVDGADNVTVKNIDNVTGWQTGIRYEGSVEGELTNNVVKNNSRNGILLTGGSDNGVLTFNDVSNNSRNGINLDVSNGSTVKNNNATDNDRNGVRLASSVENMVEGNELTGNLRNGLRLRESSDNNTANGNNLSGNVENGIRASTSSENDLTDNTVENNDDNGVYLTASNLNTLADNKMNGNRQYGIYLSEGSNDNELINNIAEGNSAGLVVESSASNTVADNTMNDNLFAGSGVIFGSEGNTLINNTVSGNLDLGIDLFSNSNDNTLVNNTVTGHGQYGVGVINSDFNEIRGNLLENNANGFVVRTNNGLSNNNFTDDTSRDNGWDFVVESGGRVGDVGGETTVESFSSSTAYWGDTDGDSGYVSVSSEYGSLQAASVSDFPVTNLNIGDSTNPDTKLSFDAEKMRLRSVGTPQPDPANAANIGRYFKAEPVPETTGSFLNVSLSYQGSDVAGPDESALRLLRFNGTASEWQDVPNSTVNTADNLASANITQFSDFGVFGEPACVNRRDLGRGQEDQECPFDRDISRGGSREELDESSGRAGDGRHRDSATSRRNRGR